MYMTITEIANDLPNMNPIRERMDVYIPEINDEKKWFCVCFDRCWRIEEMKFNVEFLQKRQGK